MTSTGYSIRSSPRSLTVWEWACRFAARLWRHRTAAYGLPRTSRGAPSFSLSCLPTVRRLLVLHGESNPTISRLVRASDADEIIDHRIDILRLDQCFVACARLPERRCAFPGVRSARGTEPKRPRRGVASA